MRRGHLTAPFYLSKAYIMTRKQKRELFNQELERHLNALDKEFGLKVEKSKFYRICRIWECRYHQNALDYCNTPDIKKLPNEKVIQRLSKLVKKSSQFSKRMMVNWDPRGYTLKLDFQENPPKDMIYDWGRDVVLAPKFDE